jgi:hypothetical protein
LIENGEEREGYGSFHGKGLRIRNVVRRTKPTRVREKRKTEERVGREAQRQKRRRKEKLGQGEEGERER